VEIRSIAVDDDVKALLSANELPIDDLDDPAIRLYGAYDGERLVGVVGLQALDGTALLRSLAVVAAHRDRGVGGRLCEHTIDEARRRGLAELWLLTTSARDYFVRRGYEPVPRDRAPLAVRTTAQFSSLCPASATVMRRPL
jgi:amino-acid N-acetyltransferase